MSTLRVLLNAIAIVLASASIAAGQPGYTYDVIYRSPAPSGVNPHAGLVEGPDGYLYGTTQLGGASYDGTIFKMGAFGGIFILRDLVGSTDGRYPAEKLIRATDGHFYGTTDEGGPGGGGTIFRITSAGVFTVLHAFSSASPALTRPSALLQAADGNFYGTTKGPIGDPGGIFTMTPDGVVTVLHEFDISSLDGISPSSLIQGADLDFYGTTYGRNGFTSTTKPPAPGNVFKITAGGTFTVLHTFTVSCCTATEGSYPVGALVLASDGNFYGTTTFGGEPYVGHGTAFRMTPAGVVTAIHSFTGGRPLGDLVQASDGYLYGLTRGSPLEETLLGEVFKLTPADGTVSILHTFTGDPDGANPYGGLVQASNGLVYGTTSSGGTRYQYGAVFRVTTAGTFHNMDSFGLGFQHVQHFNGLTKGADGNFYGTARDGGQGGRGATFRVTPAGAVTLLHHFARTSGSVVGGTGPAAPLLLASDGFFYGTTEFGGTDNLGSFFVMTHAGALGVRHSFAVERGTHPRAALIETDYQVFAGTTSSGGIGLGTIFTMGFDGTMTKLRDLSHPTGGTPEAALLQAPDGTFYGTTSSDGASFRGTVFRMSQTSPWNVTVLHEFSGTDGGVSRAPLIRATDGNFYGTTSSGGGPSSAGAIFRMTPAGDVTVLHAFERSTDGARSRAPLVQALDGSFYGTTSEGGLFDRGTVFRMTGAGAVTIVHHFADGDGAPHDGLVQAADGSLYGTTYSGKNDATGVYATGVIFRLTQVNTTPPAAPTGLVATPNGFTKIRLTWTPSENATTYNVKRGTTPGSETTLVSGVIASSYVDATVVQGQLYYYVVSAVNSAGESANSNEASAATLTRSVPMDFDGDGKADLTYVRSTTFDWKTLHSGAAFTTNTSVQWGLPGDLPAPGDYDGNGIIDPAVYRPSTGAWYAPAPNHGGAPYFLVAMDVTWAIPVPGDYDGDGKTDPAVYSPATGVWTVRLSTTDYTAATQLQIQWGLPGDAPVPGDYDGDGRTDLAVYRRADRNNFAARWIVLLSSTSGSTSTTRFLGNRTDQPVPGDYDGDGRTDPAVFGPSGRWQWQSECCTVTTQMQWGTAGDVRVPADYDGDGRADLAVYRRSSATWFVSLSSSNYTASFAQVWGQDDAIPLPVVPSAKPQSDAQRLSDVDGNLSADRTFFRPSTGTWHTLLNAPLIHQWGLSGDVPVAGDYDGDVKADRAVYRPSNGTWYVLSSSSGYTTSFTVQWGVPDDVPVPGDYDGDRITDIAVFRPATGHWFILTSTSHYTLSFVVQWGLSGDTPVGTDYDGDGKTDLAVFRPANGVWYILASSTNLTTFTSTQWGLNGDIPVPGDYDGDGKADLAVVRPGSMNWYVLRSSTNFTTSQVTQWGLPGDLPVPMESDGTTSPAVFRPSTGVWWHPFFPNGVQWGTSTDVPIGVRQ